MTDPITIGTAGTKFVYSSDTVGKTISKFQLGAATGPTAFYTVPVGKKFIVLSMKTGSASDYQNYIILKVYNSGGGPVREIDTYAGFNSSGESTQMGTAETIECFEELAAGESLRLFVSYGNGFTTVYGVETSV